MTQDKFLQATERYQDLKARLNAGEITVSDLKQALKKLMIVDEKGRYWMIGGKSGRWYRHDGTQWIQDDPPQIVKSKEKWQDRHDKGSEKQEQLPMESAMKPDDPQNHVMEQEYRADKDPERGQAVDEESFAYHADTRKADLPVVTFPPTSKSSIQPEEQAFASSEPTQPLTPATIQADTADCRVCDATIPADAEYCPFCGANQNETAPPTRAVAGHPNLTGGTSTLQVKSIHPISLLFLLGGLGLILGVILGAAFGTFQIFGDLIYQFPRMLQETRGKIQGGLIFGVLGGIAGFLCFALTALVASGLYNLLADLFGGLRIRIRS